MAADRLYRRRKRAHASRLRPAFFIEHGSAQRSPAAAFESLIGNREQRNPCYGVVAAAYRDRVFAPVTVSADLGFPGVIVFSMPCRVESVAIPVADDWPT